MSRQGASSGRLAVQKFAAHLAFLLNTGDGTVTINLGELYRKLLVTLSGTGGRRGGGANPYSEKLVAVHLLGPGTTPEQAAATYFELVVDRPLLLARRAHHHKGHEVFLALCRRGVDRRWPLVALERSIAPPSSDFSGLPQDFQSVSKCLHEVRERFKHHITAGNPAAKTREDHGPLYLRLAAHGEEIPEELSLWDAVRCGPLRLQTLAPAEFDRFCSLIIKTMETANAHYGALVTLGLSPLDWADHVTVNTAKKVSAYVTDLRQEAEATAGHPQEFDLWEQIWKRRQVPGFASPRALWSSPLGQALRTSGVLDRTFAAPEASIDEEDGAPDPEVNRAAVPGMLNKYSRAGVLDTYDVWLLARLNQGKRLDQLARSPRTLFKFGKPEIPEDYVDELRERLRQGRSAIPIRTDHPDSVDDKEQA